jgi:hypothetical protein
MLLWVQEKTYGNKVNIMTAEGRDFTNINMVQDSTFCPPSHGNYFLGIFFHFFLLNTWQYITEAFHGG